jgi:hypothetical protein
MLVYNLDRNIGRHSCWFSSVPPGQYLDEGTAASLQDHFPVHPLSYYVHCVGILDARNILVSPCKLKVIHSVIT